MGGFVRLILDDEESTGVAVEYPIPLAEGGGASLELGCGRKKVGPEFIGVDRLPLTNEAGEVVPDIMWNLDVFPWAFAEGDSCDFIVMHQTLEHLTDLIAVMNEVWRIAGPDSWVEVVVPYYKAAAAFQDPTHKHFFTDETFAYWEPRYVSRFSDYGIRGHFILYAQAANNDGNLYALLRPVKTPEEWALACEWVDREESVPYPIAPPDDILDRCQRLNLIGL